MAASALSQPPAFDLAKCCIAFHWRCIIVIHSRATQSAQAQFPLDCESDTRTFWKY